MRGGGALLMLLLATPAAAEPWACALNVRCDTLGCAAIDAALDVIAADHEGRMFIVSTEGDRPVTRLSRAGTRPAVYAGTGDQTFAELLTITMDGQATLSSHGADGAARTSTSFGTCEPL